MSEKWTKEQIELAKSVEEMGCSGISCDECPASDAKNLCHFDDLPQLIHQHEHDADEPKTLLEEMNAIPIQTDKHDHDYWRYKFAGMAMQGLLANDGAKNEKDCIEYATIYANALLKKLEEQKQ